MVAGGTVAAVGRLFPRLAFGVDPVLLGTGVNLVILIASFAHVRLVSRFPFPVSRG